MQLDPSFLQSEGILPSRSSRFRRWLIWTSVLVASAGSVAYVVLHIVPAAGAAGGCGGG